MNTIKAFLKEKGPYLACLALVFTATVAGIMAVRGLVTGLTGDTNRTTQQEGETPWTEPNAAVTNPVTDLPEPTSTPAAKSSAPPSSSGAASQSAAAQAEPGASAAPSAQQAASPASPWAVKPIQAFSGDELVYNETLGDWRTHNGADYAVKQGADVPPAKAGTVTAVYQDALWGWVVEIADTQGTLWRYCGLASAAVQPDEKVTTATTLGQVGTIPAEAHLEPHLHLECTQEEQYKDPEKLK